MISDSLRSSINLVVEKQSPFVAIWMITYNHEKYISQAIEGVINQNTNFSYRLYLGEDCSTDSTRDICKNYAAKYPDKISLYLTPQNNHRQNGMTIYDACFNSGAKYMAMCEGDDFWTDVQKLQKQVDFLELNPEYSECFHNLSVLQGNSTQYLSNEFEQKDTSTLEDLLRGVNYIGTASCLFRMDYFKIPSYFGELPLGDYFIHLSVARHGKIKFLNEVMGTYRMHSSGIHGSLFSTNTGKAKAYQQHYIFWSNLKKYDSFDPIAVDKNIIRSCAWVIQKALETKNFSLFNDYNFKFLKAGGGVFGFLKNYVRFLVYFFRNNQK